MLATESTNVVPKQPASGWVETVLEHRLSIVLVALVLTTAVVYLGYVVAIGGELAYPLDDSWIHQTFARNLLIYGGFVYNPGEPSSASTSPLWTLLLTPGYLLGVDHRIWSYLLGLLFLVLTGLLVYDLFRFVYPQRRAWAALAGVGVVLEPHLDWAALSGMETMLFIFLSLLLVRQVVARTQAPGSSRPLAALSLGLLGGLLLVTRPEGMILFVLGLAVWIARGVFASRGRGSAGAVLPLLRGADLWLCLLGFAVLVAPYVAFNYRVTGQPFPSTYYAKNFAYADQINLLGMGRFLVLLAWEIFSGPLLLLFPGLVYALSKMALDSWRERRRWRADMTRLLAWVPLIWCAGLVGAYVIRLPTLYHHGRYLMPVIPVLLIYGLWGTLRLCEVLPTRLLAKVIPVLLVVFWLARWGNGAVVYAWDVKFINDENVAVARWLRDNTPPNAVVATHDIGAIGYIARRHIVDTAGLITPEIAPFVRQYDRVLRYVELRKPDYLAIYPAWYPLLPEDPRVREIYRVDQRYAVEQGADNMVVYKFEWERSP